MTDETAPHDDGRDLARAPREPEPGTTALERLADGSDLADSVKDALDAFRLDIAARPFSPRQLGYLVALAKTSYKMRACSLARVGMTTVFEWRRDVPGFKEMEERALEVWVELVEQEVDRRAFVGVDEPVFGSLGPQQGAGQIGIVRRYSDRLAELRLRAMAPRRYASRNEISGPDGGPVQVEPVVDRLRKKVEDIAARRLEGETGDGGARG